MGSITLNKLQLKALDLALRGRNVFITGGAGTGKSFVLKEIIQQLKAAGKNVCVAAPTGMASLQIDGVTIHRLFSFPTGICVTDTKLLPIAHTSNVLKTMDTLVIDEISMVRIDIFESVIASVKKAEDKTGKKVQLIFCGDFCQLPPVISDDGTAKLMKQLYGEYGLGFAFMSRKWKACRFENVVLTEIIRQEDREFAENLNRLRMGHVDCISYFNQAVKRADPKALFIFKSNREVDARNRQCLAQIHSPEWRSEAEFEGETMPSETAGIEKELVLKEGARIVFTRNDSYDQEAFTLSGLANAHSKCVNRSNRLLFRNGDMGEVTGLLEEGMILVRLDRTGEDIVLTKYRFDVYTYETDEKGQLVRKWVGSCLQFPVRLGYAMTIHKAQGCTVDALNVGLGWQRSGFSAGQLYVALSRVKSIENLSLNRTLTESDAFIDPDVRSFYELLGKPVMGRPVKYEQGSVRIRVPNPILKHIREECEAGHAVPYNRTPKYKPGFTQIRVPAQIAGHVQNEIDSWRKKAKADAAKDNRSKTRINSRADKTDGALGRNTEPPA